MLQLLQHCLCCAARHRPRTPDEARWGGSGQPSLPRGTCGSSDGGGGSSRLGSEHLGRALDPLQRQSWGAASSSASGLGDRAVPRTSSPAGSPAVGLAPVSSLAAQLPPELLLRGGSAGGSPKNASLAAPAPAAAAAPEADAADAGTTAQWEANEEAAVAVILARAAAAQPAGQAPPHVQLAAAELEEDRRSVDSLVLPGEADLPSIAGSSSAASAADSGGAAPSPADSVRAEAGSVVLTPTPSEAPHDVRDSPSKRLLPQPPSAAASSATGVLPLPLLPPVQPMHHRRLDPLTQMGSAAVPQQQQPGPAGEEAVDVLIGDNISAQHTPPAGEPAQPAAAEPKATDQAAGTEAAGAVAGSPLASSSGFGSFIKPRNVIGRVAEKLHLGSRSGSGGFGSGGRASRHPPPESAAQQQQQQRQSQSSNLQPQPPSPSQLQLQQQRQQQEQQAGRGDSQARSKSSASSRMPTLDGGTASSTAGDSTVSDAHRWAIAWSLCLADQTCASRVEIAHLFSLHCCLHNSMY